MGKTGTWLALLLALAFFLLYYTDVASGIDNKIAFQVTIIKILIYFVWLCFSIFILLSYFEKQSDKQIKEENKSSNHLKGYDDWMAKEDQYHDPEHLEENEDDNLTNC